MNVTAGDLSQMLPRSGYLWYRNVCLTCSGNCLLRISKWNLDNLVTIFGVLDSQTVNALGADTVHACAGIDFKVQF